MSIKTRVRQIASGLLNGSPVSSEPAGTDSPASFLTPAIPKGAAEYLNTGNPRLLDLKRRYKGHSAAMHSLWKDTYIQSELDLSTFRGDNVYIWQTRQINANLVMQYLLTAYHVKDIDRLNLFDRLREDGQFGAVNFSFNDQIVVSRDLLDSILEINFLERHLRISQMAAPVVLDIGAGYGRFAYRMVNALPNLKTIYCTDAVAESTFLCDYYLTFRAVGDRARAIPIDEIEGLLGRNHIDIVTNMESFAECTVESIRWWLDLIQRNQASYFMIVVEGNTLLSKEEDKSKTPFQPEIEARGFDLIAKEPVYPSTTSVSKYGLYPDRTYFLFRNRSIADKDVIRQARRDAV
jgi:2-polyprenyl-3-methyl-5-hydroxy-6-metoxy-1,4-benzoquinol methylase